MAEESGFPAVPPHKATRSLRLAFVIDPLDSLNARKDSTVAMMRAASQGGHAVFAIDSQTLSWRRPELAHQPGVYGESIHLETRPENLDWYRELGRDVLPLNAFDAVLMRKDPPFDQEYVTATWLLERAEAEGARVFNSPRALRDHSEKLSIAEFDRYTVPSLVTRSAKYLHQFIEDHQDVILKPLDGMGGSQVFRVQGEDPNRNVIVETLSEQGCRSIMAQRYVPEISRGDKRILLIAGQVVPYCLARIPKAGETRGNLAAGGTGVAQELTARDREIAEDLAPILWQRGLMLVGIDVIGEYLTEINVTSPTCMVEIKEQTGYDSAGALIAALEKACGAA